MDYGAQASVSATPKHDGGQMAAQPGCFTGAEADMSAAEAVAAALNMSADPSALGLPTHVDHLGQVNCSSLSALCQPSSVLSFATQTVSGHKDTCQPDASM